MWCGGKPRCIFRFHSVVVSTLDFESNNTSSNLVGSMLTEINHHQFDDLFDKPRKKSY